MFTWINCRKYSEDSNIKKYIEYSTKKIKFIFRFMLLEDMIVMVLPIIVRIGA